MKATLSRPAARTLTLCTLGLAVAACGSTKATTEVSPPRAAPVRPREPSEPSEPTVWLRPSAEMERQMRARGNRFPWLQTLEERVEMVEWFRQRGEPTYPTLLGLLADPRPQVSGTALACLGAMRDPRLLPFLNEIPWPPEDEVDIRLERARTHMQLGDWSYVALLVDGLEDSRPMTRAICARSLQRGTKMDFGFDPYGEQAERTEAVARWREWADELLQDAMLAPQD